MMGGVHHVERRNADSFFGSFLPRHAERFGSHTEINTSAFVSIKYQSVIYYPFLIMLKRYLII